MTPEIWKKVIKSFRMPAWMGFLFHTVISARNISVRGWPKSSTSPFCFGGRVTSGRRKTACAWRDSQCGLFATGKVLRRFGVPFTYSG